MNEPTASSNASLLRGYAWYVYPDPASLGAMATDRPFSTGDPHGPDRPLLEPPPGLPALWTLRDKEPGLRNRAFGRAYLVLSESPKPPGVTPGWFVEPARLAERFELDQRGDRSVRLIRVVDTDETPWGPLQECEFQVDRA